MKAPNMPAYGRTGGLLLLLVGVSVWVVGCHPQKTQSASAPEQAQYERGARLLRDGNVKGAQAAFDAAMQLNSKYAPAYLAQAEIETKTGNPARAIALLESLHAAAPQTPHVLCHLAEIHVASGHFVEGITAAKAALQAEPDCPIAQTQMGLEMAEAGKWEEAIANLQAAHKQVQGQERITLVLAQMLAKQGRVGEAWKLMDESPPQTPASIAAQYTRAWLLAEYGREGKKDARAALQILDGALAQFPQDSLANLEKGRILLRTGDARAALGYLQKAVDASQPNAELLTLVAAAQARLKNPAAPRMAQSARAFAALVDKLYAARQRWLTDPENRANKIALARMEATLGNTQDAQNLLTQVLKRNPNDVEALDLLTPGSAPAAKKGKANKGI